MTDWQDTVRAAGENVFLFRIPVADPVRELDLYDLQSLIESTVSREAQVGLASGNLPEKD